MSEVSQDGLTGQQSKEVPGGISEETMFSDAKSPIDVRTLPTGWYDRSADTVINEVELTEITGVEEDMLASRRLTPYQRMNNLMINCVNRVGSHTDKAKIRTIVSELVSNDRYFLVYKIRELSLGKLYKFSFPCPACRDDQLRVVDLSEVTFPSLKDPKVRAFTVELPRSKKQVTWVVQNGMTEEKAQASTKRDADNLFSVALFQRVETIDGKPVTLKDIKSLGARDRAYLRGQFEEIEGAPDDEIEVECPNCNTDFTVEADIARKEFFFPTVI